MNTSPKPQKISRRSFLLGLAALVGVTAAAPAAVLVEEAEARPPHGGPDHHRPPHRPVHHRPHYR